MRPGQQHQQKRMRGRNNNRGKGGNQHNRSYESNGPDVKIRGTAAHIADKYVQLARDAQSAGDPISAENYLQHAEHYYRIVAANQPQYPQNPGGPPQGFVRADDEDSDDEGGEAQGNGGFDPGQQQGYPQNAPQPYEQRDNREHQQREHRQHNEGGLPAFITGGGDQQGGHDRGDRSDRDRDFRNRRNRRFGRYGRNGGQGEHGGAPEGGSPGAEPEVAPGE